MSWTIPLPNRTAQLAKGNTHPGLLLDKYAASWNEHPGNEKFSEKVQRPTVDRVADLSRLAPNGFDYHGLLQRHQQSLPNAVVFCGTTLGPLTLHLSRASALENAGLCLHPIYGFAYLPGSGLKGMAHAYACQVWLPAEAARAKAGGQDVQRHVEDGWERILRVFGYGEAPWFRELRERTSATVQAATGLPVSLFDPTKERDERRKARQLPTATAGAVVFHDAWPTQWPKLIVDIVNCHHPDYYQPPDDRREYPPGDWENPVPVNFLTVPDGVQFEFALATRRDDPGSDLLRLATEWLAGALTYLGAGAKTNAGYGAFRIDSSPPAQPTLPENVQATWDAVQKSQARAEFTATLELVTPAFLAGANQQADDCDLRPATLRGALRWWWRTLHAGHVDTATLRRMEAGIWGDTKTGGAVRIQIERPDAIPDHLIRAELFDKRAHENVGRNEKTSEYGIPNLPDPNPNKITPGVSYLAYGMDEGRQPDRKQRHILNPGAARWNVRLVARATSNGSAELVLEQAKAALGLLLHYGGVGSRARKGFGSLTAIDWNGHSRAICEAAAAQFRRAFGAAELPAGTIAEPAALKQQVGEIDVPFAAWHDVWAVLEQLGFAVQAFAKEHAHEVGKLALGLPRKIDRPKPGLFEPTGAFKAVYDEADKDARPPRPWEKARFASPWCIHLDRLSGDGYRVRGTAFVQPTLPNAADSRKLLAEFLKFLEVDLMRRAALEPRRTRTPPTRPARAGPRHVAFPTVSVPAVTTEEIAAKVAEMVSPRLLFKIQRAAGNGKYQGQFIRHRPNIPVKYQPEGGKILTEAPENLSDGVIVVAEQSGSSNQAKFCEIFGRLILPPQPPKGGPPRRRR